ncbi:dihydrofolate reductase [Azospirillum doebereinerae]
MLISLVVAASANHVIGRDGGLPWHLPSDLKRFKDLTLGKPILMGRKTWESLPRRPLPGRANLVVSHSQQPEGERDGARWFSNLDKAMDWARASGAAELCVIGGAALFRETLPLADTLHLTRIEQAMEGDTVMPPIGPEWVELWSSERFEENGLPFCYIDYARRPT